VAAFSQANRRAWNLTASTLHFDPENMPLMCLTGSSDGEPSSLMRGCAALFETACLVQESTIEMRLGPLEAPATKQHTPGAKMQHDATTLVHCHNMP